MPYSPWLARQPAPDHLDLSDARIRADFADRPATEDALFRSLRVHASAWLARIIVSEFEQAVPLEVIGRALTVLGEAALDQAIDFYRHGMAERFGQPLDGDGNPVGFCALGMGKMGGYELNLSSDIDVIFVYQREGMTDGRSQVSCEEYFDRLCKKVTPALDRLTADGRVFRVDLRLRPWGNSGAIALSCDRIEAYYEQHGRPWERMALLRARPVAGDRAVGVQLLADLKPFVYRRYLDFGALASLRGLKAQIRAEAAKKDWEADIKRGTGGIREAEFVLQVEQLIHGGRRPQWQTTSWFSALKAMRDDIDLDAAALEADYRWLRHVEHAIQCFELEQTHRMPTEPAAQAALASALDMSFADVELAVASARARIQAAFEGVVEPDSVPAPIVAPLQGPWADARAWLDTHLNQDHLDDSGRERLATFLGVAEAEMATRDDVAELAPRLMRLVVAIARRSAYLALLNEAANARALLYRLLTTSQWLADQLSAMPALLDELLDVRHLLAPPDPDEIEAELRLRLARIDDDEVFFNRLREFKAAHVLRTAATELLGERAINHASDHLTWVAESILRACVARAHAITQAKYGRPRALDGQPTAEGIAVIGYGKLGGIELSYGSDLDLVFVHRIDEAAMTDGPKPTTGQQYLQRWVRLLLQMLNVRTTAGVLYEIDTRLRPSGSKGLMVVSLSGYERYLQGEAWTWERQALVRARAVAGDAGVARGFDAVRTAVLCHPRDGAVLRDEVRAMREKMRAHLSGGDAEKADIKHASGGVVDLEFIVQYLTLRDAPSCPALTQWSDNLRLLETLAAHKAMPTEQARALTEAYLSLRTAQHRQALMAPYSEAALATAQDCVRSAWHAWLGDDNTNEA
ncbi:bifunctional [glutamate--ammonia ligase]-adenylyl-L-tyrosine phosphorylase/[glutamate--ammonia-ligase] adenylyltransferase [Litorivicinus lipolyticus]|uniref:bifunctional [glutamate--ammonia ligase]-adenylyl-L-tyrosine phosphorylase/[glutamate--ammonia-ligase] adenylyltransferase n=1 Tax=Litorivicinus lipolyticus TaxID=418701 RepID=UPI003B591572